MALMQTALAGASVFHSPLVSTPPIGLMAKGSREVFVGVPATTPELRYAAHRLRYQVFCIENKIFDPTGNPGGLECDEYDEHSLQAVLIHRPTQAVVGTVRLVLHPAGAQTGSLPFHRVCRHPLAHDPRFLPFTQTAEVGRFAISKACRIRLGSVTTCGHQHPDHLTNDLNRLLPHMTLSLIGLALQMCVTHGVRHVCAVMEPSLLRFLARLGFHFEPLGPRVEYYGLRQPCYADLARLFERVGFERHDVWDITTNHGSAFCAAGKPLES